MIPALVAVLVIALVSYPLSIQPAKWVFVSGGVALFLCAAGAIGRLGPVFAAGIAVALGEYALALGLAGGPPRLAGAIGVGVFALLAVETADFERRFRHVAKARGVVGAQFRYWLGLGVLAGSGAMALLAGAAVLGAYLPLPWPPIIALAGGVSVLGAAAAALRRGATAGLVILALLGTPLDAVAQAPAPGPPGIYQIGGTESGERTAVVIRLNRLAFKGVVEPSQIDIRDDRHDADLREVVEWHVSRDGREMTIRLKKETLAFGEGNALRICIERSAFVPERRPANDRACWMIATDPL
jgi:hypothetical protein